MWLFFVIVFQIHSTFSRFKNSMILSMECPVEGGRCEINSAEIRVKSNTPAIRSSVL